MALHIMKIHAFTLRDLWKTIIPRLGVGSPPMVPAWPPDAFALTAHALRHAGAYIGVLSNWPPPVESGKEWADHCEAVAKKWRGVVVKS